MTVFDCDLWRGWRERTLSAVVARYRQTGVLGANFPAILTVLLKRGIIPLSFLLNLVGNKLRMGVEEADMIRGA